MALRSPGRFHMDGVLELSTRISSRGAVRSRQHLFLHCIHSICANRTAESISRQAGYGPFLCPYSWDFSLHLLFFSPRPCLSASDPPLRGPPTPLSAPRPP